MMSQTKHRPPKLPPKDSKQLGQLVAKIRQRKGLTQEELAKRTGLKQSYISRLESGKLGVVTLPTVFRLAKGLRVPVDFLLRGITAGDAHQRKKILRVGYPSLKHYLRARTILTSSEIELIENLVRALERQKMGKQKIADPQLINGTSLFVNLFKKRKKKVK